MNINKIYMVSFIYILLTLSVATASANEKAKVVSTKNGTIIQKETFFSTISERSGYRGKNDNLITGTILMNKWPDKLPWSYGSANEHTFIFLGLFSKTKTSLAWSLDHRRGGVLKFLGGLWGGFNEIYFDNATGDKVHITFGGENLPILNPGQHGRVMRSPGNYDLIVNTVEGNKQIVRKKLVIEHAGESDPYIFNIGGANTYTMKQKTYKR